MPHLEMSPKRFTMATVVLPSASEQTHGALVMCNLQWVTAALQWLNIQQSAVLIVLFGCYMAGATWNCCYPGACSVYTRQPCTSLQCQFIWITYVCIYLHKMCTCCFSLPSVIVKQSQRCCRSQFKVVFLQIRWETPATTYVIIDSLQQTLFSQYINTCRTRIEQNYYCCKYMSLHFWNIGVVLFF